MSILCGNLSVRWLAYISKDEEADSYGQNLARLEPYWHSSKALYLPSSHSLRILHPPKEYQSNFSNPRAYRGHCTCKPQCWMNGYKNKIQWYVAYKKFTSKLSTWNYNLVKVEKPQSLTKSKTEKLVDQTERN